MDKERKHIFICGDCHKVFRVESGYYSHTNYILPAVCPRCSSRHSKPIITPTKTYEYIWQEDDRIRENKSDLQQTEMDCSALDNTPPLSLAEIFTEFDENSRKNDEELLELSKRMGELPDLYDKVSAQFEKETGLRGADCTFLCAAVVLQVLRQYISDKLKERLSDKEAAEKTPGHNDDEKSSRTKRRYYASIGEIKRNPVPFDALNKSDTVKNGGNPRLSGPNHRYKAIGHDPILGLFFGTANIMTKTITVRDSKQTGTMKKKNPVERIVRIPKKVMTYHVTTDVAYIRPSSGKEVKGDVISSHASTIMMCAKIVERLRKEGKKGWLAVYEALKKEVDHLMTDVRTECSLPLPFVSMASPDLARILAACGLDTWNVTMFGYDLILSKLINFIISSLHSFCYDPEKDGSPECYFVRTAHIISLSNEIATGINTAVFVSRLLGGDTKVATKFDFGGFVVTFETYLRYQDIFNDIKYDYVLTKLTEHIRNGSTGNTRNCQ